MGAIGEPAGAAASAAAVPGERPPAGPAALPERGPGPGGRERLQPRAPRAGAGPGAGGARRGAGAGGDRGRRCGQQDRRGRPDAGEVRWVRGSRPDQGYPTGGWAGAAASAGSRVGKRRRALPNSERPGLFPVFPDFLGVWILICWCRFCQR